MTSHVYVYIYIYMYCICVYIYLIIIAICNIYIYVVFKPKQTTNAPGSFDATARVDQHHMSERRAEVSLSSQKKKAKTVTSSQWSSCDVRGVAATGRPTIFSPKCRLRKSRERWQVSGDLGRESSPQWTWGRKDWDGKRFKRQMIIWEASDPFKIW